MIKNIGLIINPIAGMGGRVGLKGTDGMAEKALALGAKPGHSEEKALQTLRALKEARDIYHEPLPVRWLTCSGRMGEYALTFTGFTENEVEIVYNCREPTTASDTKAASRILQQPGRNHADLILFCGGDGTARDIHEVIGLGLPILGIPAGVKMHSGVFGINPRSVAEILIDFVNDRIGTNEVELIDLDEERYRQGEWKLRLFGIAKTPFEANYIQSGKLMVDELSEDEVKRDIAEHIVEVMEREPETLFILGSGSTVEAIGKKLGIDKTLLGIDAVCAKKLVAKDVNEQTLLGLLKSYPHAKLVLSPIGAQGFILGRGNLQLSPEIIRCVGIDNIVVISTPSKLARTPALRVDTGDNALDKEFANKNIFVVNGYHSVVLRTIECPETSHT